MAEVDLLGGVAGILDFGIIVWSLIFGLFVIGTVAILWWRGILFNSLKTKALNFEKRQGRCVWTDVDQCGTVKLASGIKYKLKKRNTTVNPPPLEFIDRVGGQDYIHLFWPDRDEAYPFVPKIWTADEIIEIANHAWIEHTTKRDGKGVILEEGHPPDPQEEFKDALRMVEDHRRIFFEPVVDESSINLLMAELATLEKMYGNKILQWMKEWGPTIMLLLGIVIFVFGILWIKDGIATMDVTCVVENVQAAATAAAPRYPELP
jgi:hypothetical protein